MSHVFTSYFKFTNVHCHVPAIFALYASEALKQDIVSVMSIYVCVHISAVTEELRVLGRNWLAYVL